MNFFYLVLFLVSNVKRARYFNSFEPYISIIYYYCYYYYYLVQFTLNLGLNRIYFSQIQREVYFNCSIEITVVIIIVISNGNRTEWSTIQGVIGRVI